MEDIWEDVPGYEGLYQASNYGKISMKIGTRINKEKARLGTIHESAYLRINLRLKKKTKSYYVHTLIALTFLGANNNDLDIDHINKIRTDNRIENLRYLSIVENRGLVGILNHNSKLTQEIAEEIRKTYKNKIANSRELAKRYNVSQRCILSVIHNQTWRQNGVIK